MDSFTCDDCGRTNRHPEDVKHSYCGWCHDFKKDLGGLSADQLLLLRALRSSVPLVNVRQVVFQRRAEQTPIPEIITDLQRVAAFALLSGVARVVVEVVLADLRDAQKELNA